MRGLHKLTGIANTIEARKDYAKIAEQYPGLAMRFPITDSMGWGRIDKQINRIKTLSLTTMGHNHNKVS